MSESTANSFSSLLTHSPLPSPPTPTNNHQTEIHWNPPNSIKRQDPSTPTKGSMGGDVDVALPMKTRRLLPPSRRVDDGEDEVAIDSPPKVVRQSRRTASISQQTTKTTIKYPKVFPKELASSSSTRSSTTKITTNATTGAPVLDSSRHSECTEAVDTFEPMDDSPGSINFIHRMESVRSMASKSMASHSTQAELDFYMRRCHVDDSSTVSSNHHHHHHHHQYMAPPQWISSSPHNNNRHRCDATTSSASTPSPSHITQRRRMLAKSTANMLRSHRPAWDRTESFCSQGSSAAWSMGAGSSLGGDACLSRASSRKSVASWNTYNSRTPTPPDHVRTTSNGTTISKPRRMIASNPVAMQQAYRPVPAIASSLTETGVTNTKEATENLRQMELVDKHDNDSDQSGTTSTKTMPIKPCLLEDDETTSDLWNKTLQSAPVLVGPPPFGMEEEQDLPHHPQQQQQQQDDNDDGDDDDDTGDEKIYEAALGPWEPQPGGSFMVYRRTTH